MGYQGEFNFEELDVSNTGLTGDLQPLASYINLRVLKASDNQLVSSIGLDQLTQLQVLDLGNNNLSDINALLSLNALTQLNLGGNSQLQALQVQTVVQNNPGLTHLNLSGIALMDLGWLPAMGPQGEFNFQELDISNTGLSGDLYPLASYINLRVLKASGNQLAYVYPLDLLTQLNVLDLSNNKLVDIIPIQSLNQLTQLNLSGNNQLDKFQVVTVVQNNPGLMHLNLSGITLLDLNWLPAMGPQGEYNFLELDFSNTSLTGDADLLATYSNLRVLNLSNNNLQLVSWLGTLRNLTLLDLRGNNNIQCSELDYLEAQLPVNVLLRPQSCIIGALPDVTIISPDSTGQYFSTSTITFIGNANDFEDGNLSNLIQWSSNLSGALGTGANFSSSLIAGEHIVTAEVVDRDGNKSSTSININVLSNTAPELVITTQDSLVINANENIVLNATVNDLEDANLGPVIQWSSSLDGFLGAGSNLSLPLSIGNHSITASVTDSAGVAVVQSISISVNSIPQVTLQSPVSGTLFMLQENVNMNATASDLEDGNISANIQWSSDIDGVLGTGTSLLKTLSLGSHTLTASITDSVGAVHSVTTQVVIDQVALDIKVYNRGSRGLAVLTWSKSRTPVDIYKNGRIVDDGAESGTDRYRFRNQATFKVCETTTNYCSPEIVATAQ
jgi:Leucine-rich repeat (LRR) protein